MGWERDRIQERAAHKEWREREETVPPPQVFKNGPLVALLGREPVGERLTDPRWHISVSRPDRVPDWEELVSAAHKLRPGVVFVIGIPPRSHWMNVHPHVLHLWELDDENLAAQWRFERQGHQPT